jgi:hypothetical protein
VAVGTSGQLAVETWNGAKWALRTVALPGETDDGVEDAPMALSCLSVTSCVFAGETYLSGNNFRTLLDTWNGKVFTPMKASTSADVNGFSPNDVSCVSAKSCVAAGISGSSKLTVVVLSFAYFPCLAG